MFEYRITKYDPALRDAGGRYTRDDWIMFAQVGTECAGKLLTLDEYERVEAAYCGSALSFLRDAGVASLHARGVENHQGSRLAPVEGETLEIPTLAKVIQRVLREEFWCRLEAPRAFLHFGWDYYMYIGVPIPCERAADRARDYGLFVESFPSPYCEARKPKGATE